MTPSASMHFHTAPGHFWAVVLGTATAYLKRSNAYLIDVLRWPIFPLVMYATWQLTYRVSGQEQVVGANAPGFLLVGMIGVIVWTATIWAGGYAIEYERFGGTIGALFLAPASRVAVVAGYGLGGIVWMAPALAVVGLLGLVTGARLHIADPLAPLAAGVALLVAALATGFALAGLFVLSHRANLLANALQMPIYLLAGLVVPRDRLPDWLQALAAAIPVNHAVEALRASCLRGADLQTIAPDLGLALLTAATFALIGTGALRRVEYVAKHTGRLELY